MTLLRGSLSEQLPLGCHWIVSQSPGLLSRGTCGILGVKSAVFICQISGVWHACKVGGSAPLQTGEEVVGAMQKQQMRCHLKAHLKPHVGEAAFGEISPGIGINT